MQIISPILKRLTPFFLFFVFLECAVRMALIGYSWADLSDDKAKIILSFLVGFGYDIVVFIYLSIPILFYAMVLPRYKQGSKTDRIVSSILFFIFTYALLFSAVGEWLFWDEFQSRYNFIAVDYLVYTTEVINNIRESYPVGLLMSLMAVISFGFSYIYFKSKEEFFPQHVKFKTRLTGFMLILLLSVISFNISSGNYARISENRATTEIARNGIYELFSAYLNNELDYNKFYVSLPEDKVKNFLKAKLGSHSEGQSPLARMVKNKPAPRKYNLVLITVESLSASFLKEFGNKDNITPHLDALSQNALFFTNLYATGTRTVYGLSALTLSMPPVPGNSIVRRPDNGNLFSLGHVLKDNGYETKFIYGGYGYFDNMNKFFSENGYDIVDRANLNKNEIHFANAWGVSDDDLYMRVMAENDKSFSEKKPFFDMIMTTSNHRPFTYPDGKIDIPSPGGRKGGVKFTDYTINQFLTEAEKKPWFKDTIFVIVADHTASSAGHTELEPVKYHIPLWVYAPGIVKPQRVDWMASQIDIAPTLLGLMGISYESRFYGKDLLKEKPERAFISNYQKLGFMTAEGLAILEPIQQYNFYRQDKGTFKKMPKEDMPKAFLNEAVGYYQGAAHWREWSHQK